MSRGRTGAGVSLCPVHEYGRKQEEDLRSGLALHGVSDSASRCLGACGKLDSAETCIFMPTKKPPQRALTESNGTMTALKDGAQPSAAARERPSGSDTLPITILPCNAIRPP